MPPGESRGSLLAVVLAAGAGRRMRSSRPKVLHELAGRPLIAYPIALARALGAATVAVVHAPEQRQPLAAVTEGCRLVEQPAARGTGDAVAHVPPDLRK